MIRYLTVAAFIAAPVAAYAHTAQSGWSYPTACCSDKDCKMIKTNEILPSKEGWKLTWRSETVAYADKRIKESGDDEFHICTSNGDPKGSILCLFIPRMKG